MYRVAGILHISWWRYSWEIPRFWGSCSVSADDRLNSINC